MFSALKQGSVLYIFEKSNTPRFTEASVTKVKPPYKRTPTSYLPADILVDIEAFGNNMNFDFQHIPSSMSEHEEGGVYITDSREAMFSKIESVGANSRNILDSRPYHETMYEFCEKTKPMLKPELAKEKEQEDRLRNLEDGISEMRNALNAIQDALIKKAKEK